MIFCVNGKFLPERRATVSIIDHGFLYGDGFYDTMRTYNGVILELPLHLDRIEKYAVQMGIRLSWSRKQMEQWLKEIVRCNRLRDSRVRLTITRGQNHYAFTTSKQPTLTIICERLKSRPQIARGISASTIKLQRILPEVKTMSLISMVVAYRAATEHGDFEMIFVGEGNQVREGAGSNVFVVKRGVLYTPRHLILRGLTRRRVIALARTLEISVRIREFTTRFLNNADEIFLTNGLWEIAPVIRLNGKRVGRGNVGPITKRLQDAYRRYVSKYIATHEQ